jgi:hypothetical protein
VVLAPAQAQVQVQATAQALAPALVQAQATGADHPYAKYGGNVAPIPDHTQPDSFWRQVFEKLKPPSPLNLPLLESKDAPLHG